MIGPAWVVLGAGSLAGLLWAEWRGNKAARAVFKISCSVGFLGLALALGPETPFARWVFAGLALSAVGDVLLLSEEKRRFLAGLAAFLAAHLAYVGAFARAGVPSPWTAVALVAAALLVLRWLWPRLGDMRLPVVAYCAVISLMLWFALGVDRPEVRLGAVFFYLSDLFVARNRFVRDDVHNRLIGLPLYYAGQYLITLALR